MRKTYIKNVCHPHPIPPVSHDKSDYPNRNCVACVKSQIRDCGKSKGVDLVITSIIRSKTLSDKLRSKNSTRHKNQIKTNKNILCKSCLLSWFMTIWKLEKKSTLLNPIKCKNTMITILQKRWMSIITSQKARKNNHNLDCRIRIISPHELIPLYKKKKDINKLLAILVECSIFIWHLWSFLNRNMKNNRLDEKIASKLNKCASSSFFFVRFHLFLRNVEYVLPSQCNNNNDNKKTH